MAYPHRFHFVLALAVTQHSALENYGLSFDSGTEAHAGQIDKAMITSGNR
jgi:hypothetical protein